MSAPLVAQLDESLDLFVDLPPLDDEQADPFARGIVDEADRLASSLTNTGVSLVGSCRRFGRVREKQGLVEAGRSRPAPILSGAASRVMEGIA